MKGDKINSIEDLFRNTLGETEVTPGESASAGIMRKVAQREFYRFNFSRLNIWYLGGLAVACAFIGIMLFSDGGKPAGQNPAPAITATDTVHKSNADSALPVNDSVKPQPLPGNNTPSATRKHSPAAGKNHVKPEIKVTLKEPATQEVTAPKTTEGELSSLLAVMKPSVTRGCVPLYVKFTSTSSGNITQEWSFGDGGTSDLKDPEWVYDVPGIYKVTLSAMDASGRKAVASTEIIVLPKPKAAFDILPDEPVIPADEITFVNQSSGATSYKWYFGDGTSAEIFAPVHKYSKQGKYNVALVAISEDGCVDSLNVQDTFTETDCYIRFPNAFLPNKGGSIGGYYSRLTDGNNMVFHPVYSGVVDYNLRIYSKQGHLVFESDDIYLGWDGYYHGELCASGVYVWRAEGKFRNGHQYVLSGDLTLVNY